MRSHRMRFVLSVSLIVLCAIPAVTALAGADSIPDHDGDSIASAVDRCPAKKGIAKHDGCPTRYVIKVSRHRPAKTTKKMIRNWKPWAQPTVPQVHIIAAEEQRKWGGPSLLGRINCESSFYWAADNGTYEGLLQFGPIWDSMYSTAPGDRRVVYKTTVTRKAAIAKHLRFDDGSRVRKVIGHIKQKIRVIRIGMLPENLTYSNGGAKHGWAAVRTGQRAVSGHGPTTGWECGL